MSTPNPATTDWVPLWNLNGVPLASVGSSFPASPVDGQEFVLVNNTWPTTLVFAWKFRYNAGSSSAYKWEFVGGTPWSTQSTVADAGVIDTWVKDARTGSTVPRAGDYLARYTATLNNTGGGARLYYLSINTDAAGSGAVPNAVQTLYASDYSSLTIEKVLSGLAAAAIIRGYWFSTGIVANLNDRTLTVIPIRVS